MTANEGDAREYDCFEEEERVDDLDLDPSIFPNAEDLQEKENLGRLTVTTTAPSSEAGYSEIHAFGARSISTWSRNGRLLWDSGDAIERLIAEVDPDHFNANDDEFDKRSDNKGPEPEGVDVTEIDGRTYAFVGTERTNGIAVFDITNPRNGKLLSYTINRDYTVDPDSPGAGDIGPEGIKVIPASQSPNGAPLLLVGNEVSGTTTIWEINVG